eukprot:1261940-Rhodomonas_salina.2
MEEPRQHTAALLPHPMRRGWWNRAGSRGDWLRSSPPLVFPCSLLSCCAFSIKNASKSGVLKQQSTEEKSRRGQTPSSRHRKPGKP